MAGGSLWTRALIVAVAVAAIAICLEWAKSTKASSPRKDTERRREPEPEASSPGKDTAKPEPAERATESPAPQDAKGPAPSDQENTEVDKASSEKVPFPAAVEQERKPGAKVWRKMELSQYNGTDRSKPLLLVVIGEVYDVGTGERFYGPGSGYSVFAGKDASRAWSDTQANQSDMSDVSGLDMSDLGAILEWRKFYRDHVNYTFVGVVKGRYFDAEGEPTSMKEELDQKEIAKDQSDKLKENLRSRWKSCNSHSKGDDKKYKVWCDDTYHGKGYVPVHLWIKREGVEPEPGWCTCTDPSWIASLGRVAKDYGFATYPECKKGKQACKLKRGADPPKLPWTLF